MKPNDCVFFMGNGSCLKGCEIQCVECKGIQCTVYDPIEEEEDNTCYMEIYQTDSVQL